MTFYYTANAQTYTVNYLEKTTNKVLAPASTNNATTFASEINGIAQAIEITGYTYDSVDPATLTVGTDNTLNVINVYYTRNTYGYTINYVEKENETNVLKTTTGEASYEEEVSIPSESFAGFTYDSQDKENIVIGLTGNVATVYYTRNTGTVKVIYVDEDNNEIIPSETYTGKYDEDYKVISKEIPKYKLSNVIGDEEGKYIDGEIIVTYVYETIPDTGLFVNNTYGYASMISMLVLGVLVVIKKKILG